MKRKVVKASTMLSFTLAALSGGLLYLVSQKVHHAENSLSRIEAQLAREEETTRVLYAEWDYLNHPARLEQLARDYLNMNDPEAGSMLVDAQDLPDPFLPALPPQKPAYKPVLTVRPVSMKAASRSSDSRPSPAPKPVSSPPLASREPSPVSSEKDEFNALLSNLGSEGVLR